MYGGVYGEDMNAAATTTAPLAFVTATSNTERTRLANARIRQAQAKLVAEVAALVALADTYEAAGMKYEALETLQEARAIQNTRLYKAIR